MISYQVYKLLHYAGIMMLFAGLGGILISHYASAAGIKGKAKMLAMVAHGVGLIFILVAGFGMLARLGMTDGLPGWIYAKLVIWLFLGAAATLARKKASSAWFMLALFVLAGVGSAYMALYKPF
ncbi:MAG: hypothetical protein AB7O96_08075 [Pseudobdellovibrionaceae bacterium]